MSVCTEFHVCVVFRMVRGRDTNTHPHIRVKKGISPTCCPLDVDLILFKTLRRTLCRVGNIDGLNRKTGNQNLAVSSEFSL